MLGVGTELDRYVKAAFWPLLFVLLVLEVSAFAGLPHDDAFIAFRYAENLARGNGLVFNPGERVLGFTSPLHVLVAALVHRALGHAALPSVMAAIGCVGWVAQASLVHALFENALGRAAAGLVALLVAVGGAWSARYVALETNVAVALSLAALALAFEERWRTSAVVVGLACLARPDAAIMALLLAVYAARQLRTRVVVPALCFLAVVLPWLAFASVYYGSPVPEPLRVKFQRTDFFPYLEHLLRQATWSITGVELPSTLLIACTLVVAGGGAALLARREPRLSLLVLYGVLELASYLYLRPFRAHGWHLYPCIFVLCLCAWSLVAAPLAAGRFWAYVPGVVLLVGYAWRTLEFARDFPTAEWSGARDATYRSAAAYLHDHVRGGALVAAVEVGTLGYYSDVRMYDLGGLVTKHAVVARRPPRPYACLAVDDHYPSLAPAGEEPVRAWTGPFPLRIFCDP